MPENEIKIGLALGGGGAKGPAHIGVLKVFEKWDLPCSEIGEVTQDGMLRFYMHGILEAGRKNDREGKANDSSKDGTE